MIKILKVYHVKKGQQLNARILHNGERHVVTFDTVLSCQGYSLRVNSINFISQSIGFCLTVNGEKINILKKVGE